MKNLFTKFKLNIERVVAAAMIFAVSLTLGGMAVMAWGPSDRATFTIETPASYVTFNSITNNSNYGDERNFVIAKDASDTSAGGWSDNVQIQDGKEYLIRFYVHNNAAANLNLVSENTRVKVNVPNNTAKSIRVDGILTSDNANPSKIWDEVNFTSDREFNLTYVNGSARYYNNLNASTGFGLTDKIVTSEGVQVGYEKMDGKVPGCFQYSGIATIKVKANTKKVPNFTVSKKVRLDGTTEWKDNIQVQPGQTVEYRVTYQNTGELQQNNVAVRDVMDSKMQYNKGSTHLLNALNPNKTKISDNIITKTGINIGHYAPGTNAGVYYKVTVPSSDKLTCGVNILKNTAWVDTDNGSKNDTATVTVKRDCDNPIKVCDLKTSKVIEIKESDFKKSQHSKNLKDCEKKEDEVTVCNIITKRLEKIKKSAFDGSKHSNNLKDCEEQPGEIRVCNLENKEVVFIKEADFDKSKHSLNEEDCAEQVVVTSELPRTGPVAMIGLMLMLTVAVAAATYYTRQQQDRKDKLKAVISGHDSHLKTKTIKEAKVIKESTEAKTKKSHKAAK